MSTPLSPARSLRTALGIVLAAIAPAVLHAQQDRISRSIDTARTTTLRGHLNPNATAGNDRGAVNPDLAISYATVYLQPSAEQRAALAKLLVDQQDPASPDFHRWLTPEEYGDRFGLSRPDAARVAAWLESQGLQVNDVARGRHWITFSGTAARVASALHTEFHAFQVDGEFRFATIRPPSIPEALADVVSGIEGLDDFYPAPAGGQSRAAGPKYTSSSGNHYLSPDDFATIYDLKPFYTAGIDGAGQTIAVIGNTDVDFTDLHAFQSRFNLPAKDPQLMLVGPDPGVVQEDEAYLDLEWAGAIARNATLKFVYAKSSGTAAQYAVDQNVAPVITQSFATCELAATSLMRSVAQQASVQGITWLAASGDGGAAACDHQGKMPQASKGMSVASPASIPEVTAVGGTEFDDSGGTYWNATNVNGASAISYIPEKAWNDSSSSDYLAASTGGPSILYPKPWWQAGTGVPSDNARDVPDIALTASASHDAYIVYANGSSYGQGGTSAATPAFAGFVTLLNQFLVAKGVISRPGLGNINPMLYRLAQTAPAAFHDISTGDNIVPCTQGTPDCATGSYGYRAAAGYDLVTGLGSIDGYRLASSWSAGAASNTVVTAAPATAAFNASVKLTATVTATGVTPTGEVSFLAGDTALGSATLSGSGGSSTATLTINAMQLPVGADTITALFTGSAALNASAAKTTVTVTAPAASSAVVLSVTPNPVYQQAPDSSGHRWTCTVRLTNESAIPTTLTKITIGGTDYTADIVDWFGGATIAGNASLSTSLNWKNLGAPLSLTFAVSGADSNGSTWSQQISVPFEARLLVQPSILLTTPATVPPDSTADPSCRWPQPLVLEEQGGYEVNLSTLTSTDLDFSSQLQQIFGTTVLGPFGRLQGTVCWSAGSAAGARSLRLSTNLVEFPTNTTSASASTSLTATATAITSAVSPASVGFTSGAASATATVSLSFSSGAPSWTATVSPANSTTSWLTVSPASGTGAAQLKLTANSSGFAKGVYSANILIQSAGAKPQFQSVPVVLVVGAATTISIDGVTNAASYKVLAAPGMLMSVFGKNLSPAVEHAAAVPLPFTMQGVTATVNGYSAPLLDVTPGQLNLQVPYEIGAGTAVLGVNNNGLVAHFPFQVQAAAPGIFMTLDGANNLVPYTSGKRGDILLAFITGEGDVTPQLITGRTPTTTDVTKLPAPALPLSISVGGVDAKIYFVGIPNALVGATQINFAVPTNAPLGLQPVVVTVGGIASAPVMLTVNP